MMNRFNCVFISHRSFDYDKAVRLKECLLKNQISQKVILWENESLCKNYEQLTVHEYFEAIEKIRKSMVDCDAFFFLNCENYENGYFTSAELLLWRKIQTAPMIYPVEEIAPGSFRVWKALSLTPLDKYQSRRLSFNAFLMEHNPEFGGAPESYGKYAHNCFLVGCCACGEYYLTTKKAMAYYVVTQELAVCPHCGVAHARFYQHSTGRKYFSNRFPVVMSPHVNSIADLHRLEVDEIIELLNAKKVPARFKLVIVHGEKLHSDFVNNVIKIVKTIGKIAIVVGTTVVGRELIKDKKQDDKEQIHNN